MTTSAKVAMRAPVLLARLAARAAVADARVRLHKGAVEVDGPGASGVLALVDDLDTPEPFEVRDARVGVLATAAPQLAIPTFLRLARPASPTVDDARATFVLVLNSHLKSARGGWADGPGLLVRPGTYVPGVLAAELHRTARAIRALGELHVAEGYRDFFAIP